MSKHKAFEAAREAFTIYANAKPGDAKVWPSLFSMAQVELNAWVNRKVPKHTLPGSTENVLGLAEEFGELTEVQQELIRRLGTAIGRLSHLELNISQGRRYANLSREELRRLKADAIADIGVFLLQLCTCERVDFGTLLAGTLGEVMDRDWVARPLDANIIYASGDPQPIAEPERRYTILPSTEEVGEWQEPRK